MQDRNVNVRSEPLENHRARLTVAIDAGRLEEARQRAARKIAAEVRIPGFRKGKAPYRVLASHVGEALILETAVEDLGSALYPVALGESGLEPYGPGTLEEFDQEPEPTFHYTLPLQPVVDLGDYRALRREYARPQVADSEVDDALHALQEREALVEESPRPVAPGNRVHVTLTATVLDDAAVAEDEDGGGGGAGGEGGRFMDGEGLVIVLDAGRGPAPGFTDALAGAAVDETREFELQYPQDEAAHGTLAGKRVAFSALVRKIEIMTLPELNDDFAARVSSNEAAAEETPAAPANLLTLRMRTRERLNAEADERATAEYAQGVLEAIIAGATFSWPEALLQDQLEHMLQRMDQDLRQRGLTLEDYIRMSGTSREELREQSRENAIQLVQRSLALAELARAERVEVSEEALEAEIDRNVTRFGAQAAAFRSIYDNPDMRQNLRNEVQTRQVMERIAAIARGELSETQAEEADAEGDTP